MPENRKILLLGVGGHGKSVLDSLLTMSCYDTIAFIDKKIERSALEDTDPVQDDMLSQYPLIGSDSDLEHLYMEGYTDAFIAVGSIGDVSIRRKLYELIKQIGFHVPNIIDSSSVVSPYASLGEGIFIGKNAVVNAGARIGNCAIINTSCVIEHECGLGDYVHIASGSILSGKVQIEEGAHIGAGSVIRQGIQIGACSMIGIGSVVVKDIRAKAVAYGNPCREVKHE